MDVVKELGVSTQECMKPAIPVLFSHWHDPLCLPTDSAFPQCDFACLPIGFTCSPIEFGCFSTVLNHLIPYTHNYFLNVATYNLHNDRLPFFLICNLHSSPRQFYEIQCMASNDSFRGNVILGFEFCTFRFSPTGLVCTTKKREGYSSNSNGENAKVCCWEGSSAMYPPVLWGFYLVFVYMLMGNRNIMSLRDLSLHLRKLLSLWKMEAPSADPIANVIVHQAKERRNVVTHYTINVEDVSTIRIFSSVV